MSEPTNNVESLLTAILKNDSSYLVVPQSRVEELLLAIYKNGGGGGGGSDITRYEVEQMLLGKVDTKLNYSLISDSEIERLAGVDNYDDKSIRNELGQKVEKKNGYSLILNTDYDNFKKLENYDDSELRGLINDISSSMNSLVPNTRTVAGIELSKNISKNELISELDINDKVDKTELLSVEKEVEKKQNKTFVEAVDSETSVVTVPNDVAGFAAVAKIGGKTIKDGDTLKSAPVKSVVSQGKNLFRLNNETTRTSGGVTCTYNNDGSITLNGTSTATATFPLMGSQSNPVYDFATDTYSLIWSDKSGTISDSGIGLKLGDAKSTPYDGAATSTGKIYTLTGDVGYIYIRISSGKTLNNLRVYPMLVKGTATSDSYSSYNKTTVSIPQEILNLPDYGVESNVVDFENGTYTHNKTISNGEVVDYTGADKIIDISSILYPFPVESGGTITFENEHNLDVNNMVIYQKGMV